MGSESVNGRVCRKCVDLYSAMQNLNRAAIKYIAGEIKAGMNLQKIKAMCEDYLLKNGADSFWYGRITFGGIMQERLSLKMAKYATRLTE